MLYGFISQRLPTLLCLQLPLAAHTHTHTGSHLFTGTKNEVIKNGSRCGNLTGECKHIKILRIRSVARAPKIQHCLCCCCCLNGNLSVRIKVDCIQNYRLLVDRQLRQPVGVASRRSNRLLCSLLPQRFYDNFALLLCCQQVLALPFLPPPLVALFFLSTCCYCRLRFVVVLFFFIFALQQCRYLPLWPFFVAPFSCFFSAVLHSLLASHCCGQP